MKKKIDVSHMIIMGDSLSDRGTFNKRLIFGVFPASRLHQLSRCSPRGRFTNGYVWTDHLAAMLANDFLIADLKEKYSLSNVELSDAILFQEPRILKQLRRSYHLNDDHLVQVSGANLLRCYSEGGLTSFDYRWRLSVHPVRCVLRIILSTLAQKRKELLEYDEKHHISALKKSKTLIVEWSGSNDLLTVNASPSFHEADRVIDERIKNIQLLIQKGYRHFLLFNLPNVSLTPKFQSIPGRQGVETRALLSRCTSYFNQNFLAACKKLQSMYLHCQIEVFDVNSFFVQLYRQPSLFAFTKTQRTMPYIHSQAFCIKHDKTSPAKDYLFWDDIHPSARVQAILAKEFYLFLTSKYKFQKSSVFAHQDELVCDEKRLMNAFRLRYKEISLEKQWGIFRALPLKEFNYRQASLEETLYQALYAKDQTIRKTLMDLQWLNEKDEVKLNCPVLNAAFIQVNKKFCCCCAAVSTEHEIAQCP